MKTSMTFQTLLTCLVGLFMAGSLTADDSEYNLGPPPGTYKILYADSVIKIPFEV